MPETSQKQTRSVSAVISGVMLGLFLTRYLVFAESAGQGETLWIVGLWLLAGFACNSVNGGLARLPRDWFAVSVFLLAGGHLLSALVVIGTAGEKRSAINLAWEWAGVTIAWVLLRQACRTSEFRREWQAGLLAVGLSVAGLGLYQHYVEIPQRAAHYGPLFDQLRNAKDPEVIASLQKKLAADHIPHAGPGLILFEKRLRDSREPTGRFALANTLGGFLAVCLILAVSVSAAALNRQQGFVGRAPWLVLILTIGWCLLLTKSRTAWVASAMGLTIWLLMAGYVKVNRAWLQGIASVVVVLLIIAWGLSWFGGLDRQVLTEAPKSLQYRIQYWKAALPIVLNHPWFGVGPGQFRSNYLLYKLPEASEEIADPHNIFLDVACSGGIFALIGLLGCCLWLAVPRNWRGGFADSSNDSGWRRDIARGIGGLSLLSFGVLLVTGADDQLLILLPIAFVTYLILRHSIPDDVMDQKTILQACLAAGIALIIHLCGAGGIEMPAISLLLLMLAMIGTVQTPCMAPPQRWQRIVGGVVSLILLVALYLTGVRPVSIVEQQMAAGDELVSKGNLPAADQAYLAATIADPLAEQPRQRRAELAIRLVEENRFQSDELFQKAIQLLEDARSCDPFNPHADQRIGQLRMSRYRKTHHPSDAQQAVAQFELAWSRYPTSAELMTELAEAFAAAGRQESARTLAQKALRQDDINHAHGHVDRYLPERLRENMQNLAQSPP